MDDGTWIYFKLAVAGTSYSRSRNVSRHVHILFYSEESTSDYLSCAYKSV